MNLVESCWDRSKLSSTEQERLGESFNLLVHIGLERIRQSVVSGERGGGGRLEFLLRCIASLKTMKAFASCCPFHKEIRGEVVLAVRRGTTELFGCRVDRAGLSADLGLARQVHQYTRHSQYLDLNSCKMHLVLPCRLSVRWTF